MKLDEMKIKRKNPINRNNLFFSDSEFDFNVSIGMEYVNNQINQTVVLYEVDYNNTKSDDIYQEAKFSDMTFKTPVELNVIFKLDKHEMKTYDTTAMRAHYAKVGKFTFGIYEKELNENGCDIKRGDYIGLQVTPEHMEYFVVVDDGRVNYDNAHTIFGTKPFYRSVTCATVNDKKETSNLA